MPIVIDDSCGQGRLLNGAEAQAILRFARALGCTAADVAAETHDLDEWLHALG